MPTPSRRDSHAPGGVGGDPRRRAQYGRPATTMWQELELFQQLVTTGKRPDLVVFYDGFNDLAGQLNQGLTHDPTNYFDPTTGDVFGTAAKGAAAHGGGSRSRIRRRVGDLGRARPRTGTGPRRTRCTTHSTSCSEGVPTGPRCSFADPARSIATRSTTPAPDESTQAAENTISIQGRAAKVTSTLAFPHRRRRLVLLAAQRVHQTAPPRGGGVPAARELRATALGSRRCSSRAGC